jgi:hypothetical protein
MTKDTKSIKEFIRQPFAWPGAYPMALLMADGEVLCHKCSHENFKQISYAATHSHAGSWEPCAPFINWEDEDLFCCHCDEKIASAYGVA